MSQKPPWKIFYDELTREASRREFESQAEFVEMLTDVVQEAVIYHLTSKRGWDVERAEKLCMEFLEVTLENERTEWGEKLKATWERWQGVG